jgi:hypothetical protein
LGENPKPSRHGSVSGALCETGMGDGAWGWHGGTYQAAAVVGSWGRETQGGEGGLGEKPETELPWLGFRLQRGCRKWRGGAVGLQTPPPVLTYGWGWGVRWYGMGGWWFGCTHLAPLLLLLLFSTHSLPLSTHSFPSLKPTGGLCDRCLWSVACVVDERDTLTWRVWRSFKLRSFSIAISIFIVAYSTGLIKSLK